MNIETLYKQTQDYLYSFVDFSMTRAVRYSPEQFDLKRMVEFSHFLGDPQKSYPVIHVAGTKGKGSVSAFCAGALQAAGYRVGLYTSPHLVDYAERIQINRNPIPHHELVQLVDELRPYLDQGTQLTTFEITTGLAFWYFARQGVDVAVFEVGLGGRLDATNIVIPKVSVITSLSYDHTQFLGNTLAEIAAEKAGIIKPGVPVVLSPQKDEARHVVERVAVQQGSPIIEAGRDFMFAPLSHSFAAGQILQIWPKADQLYLNEALARGLAKWELIQLTIPLLGYHQIENAATAYAALKIFNIDGLPVTDVDIQQGFSQISWPGRFEILQNAPFLVLDCAHNRDSASKLRLALDDYFPGQKVIMVFGASEDKDIQGMFAELLPRVGRVIATRSYHPRAIDPQEVVELADKFGRPAHVVERVEEALDEALIKADQEAVVLVTGSIFVVAAARDTWYNHRKIENTHG